MSILFRDAARNLLIDRTIGPDPGVVGLLEQVEWGTSGPRYRMHRLAERVQALGDAHWLRLWHDDELVGCYGLAPRTIAVGDQQVASFHRTMLAVDAPRTNRGWGRQLVTNARRVYLAEAEGPTLLYGYIEADNARSLRLSHDVGYRSAGTFTCRLVSRRRPRSHPRVRRARPDDRLAQELQDTWGQHVLGDNVVDSLDLDSAWVIADGSNRPLAALQARRERWTITRVPGRRGRLLKALMPALRPFVPALDGRDLSYLRLSHLWAASGQTDALRPLLSGVLAHHQHHAAVHFGDPTCERTTQLRAGLGRGLLGRIGVEPVAHVMVGAKGVDLAPWVGRSLWVSPADPA